MKYFKILVILIFTVHLSNAKPPIDKGTWNISGEIFYKYIKEHDGYNTNYLKFSPGIHHFFFTNISVGMDISYERVWYTGRTQEYYTIDPGIRLYLLTGEKIFPFLFSSYNCYWRNTSDNNDFYGNFDMKYGFGVDIFISKNIALEPYFTYHMAHRKSGDEIYGKYKMFETGVSVAIFIF
jgi:hypothetical protein